jgi:DNA transposition AAA+ family ATPase
MKRHGCDWLVEGAKRAIEAAERRFSEENRRANDLQALADDRLALMRANEKGWREARDDLTDALRKIEAGLGYPILYREVARAALDRQEQT